MTRVAEPPARPARLPAHAHRREGLGRRGRPRGLFGGSFGGYSACWQLVQYPDLWDAGIAWIGITDLPALFEESMAHFKTILRENMGDPDANADRWRERSPVTHVENIEAPC